MIYETSCDLARRHTPLALGALPGESWMTYLPAQAVTLVLCFQPVYGFDLGLDLSSLVFLSCLPLHGNRGGSFHALLALQQPVGSRQPVFSSDLQGHFDPSARGPSSQANSFVAPVTKVHVHFGKD